MIRTSKSIPILNQFFTPNALELHQRAMRLGLTFNYSELLAFLNGGGSPSPETLTTFCSLVSLKEDQFILTGQPSDDELFGFDDVTLGGFTGYFIEPILVQLIDYMCKHEPSMGHSLDEWDCTESRGYIADTNISLKDNLEEVEDNSYPNFEVKLGTVLVGRAVTKERANWFNQILSNCLKQMRYDALEEIADCLSSLLDSSDLDQSVLTKEWCENFFPEEWQPKDQLSPNSLTRWNEIIDQAMSEDAMISSHDILELISLSENSEHGTLYEVLTAQSQLGKVSILKSNHK